MVSLYKLKKAYEEFKKNFRPGMRLGLTQLGTAVMGIVLVMVISIIAVLLGGVMDSTTASIFNDLNVSSEWADLRTRAATYSINGINILLVGIIVGAALGLLAVVWNYFKNH